jgi:hypothetical protein
MEASKIQRFVFETDEDWKHFRKGLFTSSQINRLMADPTKKEIEAGEVLSKGAKTYIYELIANVRAEPKTQFYSASMEWGNEQEPQAVLRLAELLGMEVTDKDFIYTSIGGFVFFTYAEKSGGTPDLILPDAIAEIKCPDSHTHLYYKVNVTAENIASELPDYYDQMQHNMMLCQRPKCLFMSFDPRYKEKAEQVHIVEVLADAERQAKILQKIEHATAFKNFIIEKLSQ